MAALSLTASDAVTKNDPPFTSTFTVFCRAFVAAPWRVPLLYEFKNV
jgi:hypothetical protein